MTSPDAQMVSSDDCHGNFHGDFKVAYVHSMEYLAECDRNPRVPLRTSMVHELIDAYGLLRQSSPFLPRVEIVQPRPASIDELRAFHSAEYIDRLMHESDGGQDDDDYIDDHDDEEHGLGHDCPSIPNLFEHVAVVAGGTIVAAQCLTNGTYSTAINWAGGWHHGRRDEASGFCYVNDVVLGILKLREVFDRVLYVDLDVHHGDAVQDAFAFSSKVMTVSLHKFEAGFFPGTGDVTDVGQGRGAHYAVNVPLRDGVDNGQFCNIFGRVMSTVKQTFRPNATVCQCGADGLSGDPMASFCLTEKGLGRCIQTLLDWRIPVLFLGGGEFRNGTKRGYHLPNTARCWTYLTSIIVGRTIPTDIPEHPFFNQYGPAFDLEISPSNRTNENHDTYIKKLLSIICENLQKIN